MQHNGYEISMVWTLRKFGDSAYNKLYLIKTIHKKPQKNELSKLTSWICKWSIEGSVKEIIILNSYGSYNLRRHYLLIITQIIDYVIFLWWAWKFLSKFCWQI